VAGLVSGIGAAYLAIRSGIHTFPRRLVRIERRVTRLQGTIRDLKRLARESANSIERLSEAHAGGKRLREIEGSVTDLRRLANESARSIESLSQEQVLMKRDIQSRD
jgi:predicted RNase H-like nuclease (RuvC/YqgF family)